MKLGGLVPLDSLVNFVNMVCGWITCLSLPGLPKIIITDIVCLGDISIVISLGEGGGVILPPGI